MIYVAVEQVDGKYVAQHQIRVPDVGDKGYYMIYRSFTAFKKRMQDYLFHGHAGDEKLAGYNVSIDPLPGQYFYVLPESEYKDWADFLDRIFKPSEHPLKDCPAVFHEQVYAFYDAVGYSKETKRLKSWAPTYKGR